MKSLVTRVLVVVLLTAPWVLRAQESNAVQTFCFKSSYGDSLEAKLYSNGEFHLEVVNDRTAPKEVIIVLKAVDGNLEIIRESTYYQASLVTERDLQGFSKDSYMLIKVRDRMVEGAWGSVPQYGKKICKISFDAATIMAGTGATSFNSARRVSKLHGLNMQAFDSHQRVAAYRMFN